jgi:hypothetical protein
MVVHRQTEVCRSVGRLRGCCTEQTTHVRLLYGRYVCHSVGRAAGAVRWLEQNHVDMRIVTYVWLSLLLSVLLAVCLTFAFKHRHVVRTYVVNARDVCCDN